MTTALPRIGSMIALGLLLFALGCGGEDARQEATADDRERLEDFAGGDSQPEMPKDAIHGHGAPMDGMVAVGPLTGELPEGWTSVRPASSMRQAQYALDPAEGDDTPGEVTVFYFGPNAGTVQMNIDRWHNQFEPPAGASPSEAGIQRETFKVDDLEVTLISFIGTMKASSMQGAPSTPEREGWMNVSAIVMTPQGPWFFKGTGPEATMRAHTDRFKQMLRSLEYSEMNAHG